MMEVDTPQPRPQPPSPGVDSGLPSLPATSDAGNMETDPEPDHQELPTPAIVVLTPPPRRRFQWVRSLFKRRRPKAQGLRLDISLSASFAIMKI